jgi:hypothetical protein
MADQCHDLIRQLFFYRAQELVLPMLPASIGTAASPVPGMSGAGEPRPAGRATVLDAVFFELVETADGHQHRGLYHPVRQSERRLLQAAREGATRTRCRGR